MPPSHTSSPGHLPGMADEQLVVLARHLGCGPASQELLSRYYPWANRWIARLGRTRGLARPDVEDAQQEAVFALAEAIARYDTARLDSPGGCRFRTFLVRVITGRFHDFSKRLRRLESHYDRSVRLDRAPGPESRHTPGGVGDAGGDPAASAERRELSALLEANLRQLDDAERGLWECLAAGLQLREVASRMGLSYVTVKRRRKRLLVKLAGRLGASCR